jgi:uncharacterized protein (DUF433 family)
MAGRPRSQGFYSVGLASRLTGIPSRTLRDWHLRGVVQRDLAITDSDGRYVQGYSYYRLTLLKIVRAVRDGRYDLETAANALDYLYRRFGMPENWPDKRVHVWESKIFADGSDEWGVTEATLQGQSVETRLMGDLFEELRADEGASILVPTQFRAFVTIHPDVMGGQPVVRGTRVPTSVLAALVSQHHTVPQITRMYPFIGRETVTKALEYEQFLDGTKTAA